MRSLEKGEVLMKIYLIMPVRAALASAQIAASAYLATLEAQGHSVHFPPRDAPQDDPTGQRICEVHRAAMEAADEVHVLWDIDSKGSHFDLGMAYAMRKPIVPAGAPLQDSLRIKPLIFLPSHKRAFFQSAG
jgi:nucleoside 2-deoxyribosyltransferase